MNSKQYILALDQGTTSSRAIIFDHDGTIKQVSQKEFKQIYPKPGWVEHDANEIWESQVHVLRECVKDADLADNAINAIGITNQRETTIIWNRETGKPIHNAIVWQDRRTANYCDTLKAAGKAELIQNKTGLVIDAYFSGTKIKWLLDNVDGARELANEGKLAFGTVDSWLVWNLTGGKVHVTDVTNASRTMIYNIRDLKWDNELLDLLDIPASILPEVRSSSEVYGKVSSDILAGDVPISGIAGDQQSALFGQMCTKVGMAKSTYGTGCFLMMNTGQEVVTSTNNLLSTIAWQVNGETHYALEGSVFVGGAVIQWLRDGIGILDNASDSEAIAMEVDDNGGVYFVPALTGLGAPHWDAYARGTIIGITRGTNRSHLTRAAIESICYQVNDVVKAMEADTGKPLAELRVDGGAVANNLLLQFQADILRTSVARPTILETTALGAAYLAGLATGYWSSMAEIESQWGLDKKFEAVMENEKAEGYTAEWDRAVGRAKMWIQEEQT